MQSNQVFGTQPLMSRYIYALLAKLVVLSKQSSSHMNKMCGNEVFLCREILFLYSLGGASVRERIRNTVAT